MPRSREAQAAYMRAWRARNGIGRDLDQSRAYKNALAELRDRHRDEFEDIYRRLAGRTDRRGRIVSTHGLDPAFDDAVREVTQAFCDGPVCVECCTCRDCGRKVGTRHLDVCACPPDAVHYRCPDCAAKRVTDILAGDPGTTVCPEHIDGPASGEKVQ